MSIIKFKLTNTFLTAANTVGMQWEQRNKGALLNQFTIWLDHKGDLKTTSAYPVPVDVFEQALDYYEKNEGKLLNETYA
jgi:hypothetical protein